MKLMEERQMRGEYAHFFLDPTSREFMQPVFSCIRINREMNTKSIQLGKLFVYIYLSLCFLSA
jgi:hypothetical protein